MQNSDSVEEKTSELYGQLWPAYDRELFQQSVDLFERRLNLAGFDKKHIVGKRCLDAGCGGGRNSIALAKIGASSVVGVDIGKKGLEDARYRAATMGETEVKFVESSILDMPFEAGEFDFIWCAGVLMHTVDPDTALKEAFRVLKSGGYLFLLVYATGGLRWPLVQLLRPIAAILGMRSITNAVEAAGLPANKRRTILDDLFVPAIDFFTWPRLEALIERTGFESIERWSEKPRLDHEASMEAYREDLASYLELFVAGQRMAATDTENSLYTFCRSTVEGVIGVIDLTISEVDSDQVKESTAMSSLIGQGHHRVIVKK